MIPDDCSTTGNPPNVVLGTLALTVLLVTAGIVLADDGLGFIRSFACGHDDPKIPENWGRVGDQILDHASYGSFTGARLDGSDGPSLDGLFIEHFDLNDDDLNEDWVWNASGIPLDQNDFGTRRSRGWTTPPGMHGSAATRATTRPTSSNQDTSGSRPRSTPGIGPSVRRPSHRIRSHDRPDGR